MVCTNDRDTTIIQGLTQGITIVLCLDGGVALDTGTKGVVVAVGEVEVGDHRLGSDKLRIEN